MHNIGFHWCTSQWNTSRQSLSYVPMSFSVMSEVRPLSRTKTSHTQITWIWPAIDWVPWIFEQEKPSHFSSLAGFYENSRNTRSTKNIDCWVVALRSQYQCVDTTRINVIRRLSPWNIYIQAIVPVWIEAIDRINLLLCHSQNGDWTACNWE
jgi:hypothetical protein